MDVLNRGRLYAQTLIHLKPWQVAGRLVAHGKRRANLTRLPAVPPGMDAACALRPRVPFPQHEPWNTRAALRAGRFCFLNRTEPLADDLEGPIDWAAARMPLLWRFNLHYFHYLHLLPPDEQARLCRTWAAANPPGTAVAWHPYPTSLRIVNWCRAGLAEPDLQASLYRQAAYLYRNLETYVYGNHLLENARALVLAGCFFGARGEAPRWLAKGLDLYRAQTRAQVLPDGGHFERSPMYHALMLEGYLDVLNVLPPGHADLPWLEETVRRMSDALAALTHPDGEIALFNDATLEIALPAGAVQAYVAGLTGHVPHQRDALPDTGYFIVRDEAHYLVIDGGAVGPAHLMAHAHADVFSYEWSAGGQRFIVDSGVYEYPPGAMRQYVRSTAAHNTVGIDGQDQVECWGSFRVARRAAPHDVRFRRDGAVHRFEGRFGGYAKLLGDGLAHHRRIDVDAGRRRITVTDEVQGRGRHRVESRIHLHPDVTVTPDGAETVLRRAGATCRLADVHGALRWEEGWYCPAFGRKEANRVAVLGGDADLPVRLSYTIAY